MVWVSCFLSRTSVSPKKSEDPLVQKPAQVAECHWRRDPFSYLPSILPQHLMVYEMEQASILSCSLVTCQTKMRIRLLWIINLLWLPAKSWDDAHERSVMFLGFVWLCHQCFDNLKTCCKTHGLTLTSSLQTKACPTFLRSSTKVYESAPHIFRNRM